MTEAATTHFKIGRIDEWRELQTVRLRALRESPEVFTSTHAEESGWSADRWRARLDSRQWICARAEEGVVGIGSVEPGRPTPADRYVESVWVDPGYRFRGVLRALLATAASSPSIRETWGHLVLWVLEENADAWAAYHRLGFGPAGRRQQLADGRYEVLLRRSL